MGSNPILDTIVSGEWNLFIGEPTQANISVGGGVISYYLSREEGCFHHHSVQF